VPLPRAGGFSRRGATFLRAFRPYRLAGGGAALGGRTPARGGGRLARKRLVRCGGVSLTLQRAADRGDLLLDGRECRRAALVAYSALRRVFGLAPRPGGGSFTPERLAFDKPIAMACLVERAPCFPSRTWCISSRTNSPACVDGALPARLSARARSTVSFSGIRILRVLNSRNLNATSMR
jgi:hypothetical protein